jgi:DedD protein
MAKFPPIPESEANPKEVQSQLIKRLAFAGLLVAALLGVLAFFDYLAVSPEEPDVQVFTKPVPVAPKKEVSQPVTPASNLPPPPVPVETTPAADVPPPPMVAVNKPAAESESIVKPIERIATKPVIELPVKTPQAKTTTTAPSQPAPKAQGPAAREPRGVPESADAPIVDAPPPVVAQGKPSARVIETKSQPPVAAPMPQRLFSGFLVQAGVFTSAERAEELHARLSLSGVPSTLETRVQVGPFKTRQEAEAAQAKLKALGIESLLVPPKGGR